MTPRCGKPVRRKEQGGIAVLEDPVCGRRENHPGRCRSEAAMERARRADAERLARRGHYAPLRSAGASGPIAAAVLAELIGEVYARQDAGNARNWKRALEALHRSAA